MNFSTEQFIVFLVAAGNVCTFVYAMKCLYDVNNACVKMNGDMSEGFKINTGVHLKLYIVIMVI